MYVALGENIEVANNWDDKWKLTNHIRDLLATLKWRIFESVGIQGRVSYLDNYRQTFIDSIIDDNKDTSYTEQDVIDTMFRDKNITFPEDAFAHLNDIKPTIHNAFLFNKRFK